MRARTGELASIGASVEKAAQKHPVNLKGVGLPKGLSIKTTPLLNERIKIMANIGNHTFVDGVIRMDLLALSPVGRDQDGNPTPEFVGQLVMSPPAFMRMVSALGQTGQAMQDKGMLTGQDADAGAESPVAAQAGSPNFG